MLPSGVVTPCLILPMHLHLDRRPHCCEVHEPAGHSFVLQCCCAWGINSLLLIGRSRLMHPCVLVSQAAAALLGN